MAANEGRMRLDKTLTSPALAHKESVNLVVKRHLLKSSLVGNDGKVGVQDIVLGGKYFDEVAQHWSTKVWTFLEALRSASAESLGKIVPSDDSGGSSRDWKVKDQNDRHRVMYREGPIGTPFHTLCLDGVMDGNMPSALCVAWEVPLYHEWWPQFTVPTFKITEAKWLRKVRVGEGLSLLRFKVPWPVAAREVVMSAFELEYEEEDLIVVILESAPDGLEVNEKLHGYSADDLPAPSPCVRMDLAGGFVMQRISSDQFFFRTIADLDMKLDFVPPWMINFISRQLASQGLKLYQKTITAVRNATGSGKAFQHLLKTEALYERIRLKMDTKAVVGTDPFISLPTERTTFKDNLKPKTLQGSLLRMGSSEIHRVVPFPGQTDVKEQKLGVNESSVVICAKSLAEPQFQGSSKDMDLEAGGPGKEQKTKVHSFVVEEKEEREYDDPEVEWALTILDKMIAYSRTSGSGSCVGDSPKIGLESAVTNVTATVPRKSPEISKSKKPPLAPAKGDNHGKANVKPWLSPVLRTKWKQDRWSPPRLQSWSSDTDVSATSSYLTAGEIEVVLGPDETDMDVVKRDKNAGEPSVQEPEVQSRRKQSRWAWACFSPGPSRTSRHSGTAALRDSGRLSAGQWRSSPSDSGRSLKQHGYATEGDERRQVFDSGKYGDSDARFVTLGELLMDDER